MIHVNASLVGMSCPQVVDGEDGLHIWSVAANILTTQSRTVDKGWVGCGANDYPP